VDSRLHDMLMLVSRVQDKRGDIRFMVRQDPAVQREVHAYLDDVQWLTQVRTPAPSRTRSAASKQTLMLQVQRSRRHQLVPARVLGAAVSLSLFAAIVATNQQVTRSLPGPVDQAVGTFFHRKDQAQASPLPFDLSTPAESALDSAGSGFTN
jgi:hypothetical protein